VTTATDEVLGPRLATDPAAPLVTHYDVGRGSRVELSVVTTANWAAKIAGLLRDELGVAPGDVVAVDVPGHWLAAGVLLGAWWAGAEVRTGPDAAAGAAVLVTTPERLDAHPGDVETLVMTTDPMGRPVTAGGVALPPGVADLAESCRIHPDSFSPAGGSRAALDGAPVSALASAALGGRVLLAEPAEPLAALAGVFASGGSAVLVTGLPADEAGARTELDRVAGAEHAAPPA